MYPFCRGWSIHQGRSSEDAWSCSYSWILSDDDDNYDYREANPIIPNIPIFSISIRFWSPVKAVIKGGNSNYSKYSNYLIIPIIPISIRFWSPVKAVIKGGNSNYSKYSNYLIIPIIPISIRFWSPVKAVIEGGKESFSSNFLLTGHVKPPGEYSD